MAQRVRKAGDGRRPDVGLAVRELSFLQRLAQAAASTHEPTELMELIIRETTSAMGTNVCSIYLLQQGGKELSLSATNGLNERMVGKVTMRVGEGVTGWVAESRRPLVVPDVAADPHWKWIPGLDQQRFHSMLSVPIESGPRLVGVLNVQTVDQRSFSEADIEMLRAIAGQMAGIIERSQLQGRLEEQLEEVRRSHDIHERFTRLSLDGAGIPVILEAVSALAGAKASLFSSDGYRFRSTSEGSDGAPGRLSIPPALLRDEAREVRISAGRPPREFDLLPVRAGTDLLAVLAVGVGGEEIDQAARRRALEHGSTVLALELSKEKAAAEVERRLRGDLVEELLGGGLEVSEADQLARQAERLGHRLPQAAWVVVLELDDPESESGMGVSGRQDRLDAALNELAGRRAPGALTLVRATSVVMLVPEEAAPELGAVERLGSAVQAASAPFLRPGTASVGIGNLATSVADLSRSHQEARQALRLLHRAGGRATVTSYRSLGAFRLLLEVQSPDALRRFVEEVLGPLVKYAESRETPLLETLEALTAARWVRRQAARDLGVHINSLAYRIERIEAISGLSLDDPEARVAIAIALRARSMLG